MAVRSRPRLPRPQHVDAGGPSARATPSSSRLTSSSVSSTISSGTRSSSSRSSTGHASAAARSAIVACVRARSPKPCSSGVPVHSSARSQRWSGFCSSWACGTRRTAPATSSSSSASTRSEIVTSCGRSRGSCRWCRASRAWSRCSNVGRRSRPRREHRVRRRRRPRHRVGDGVQQRRGPRLLRRCRPAPASRSGPRRRRPARPPASSARLPRRRELPGRDETHRQQRGTGEQPDAGVQVLAQPRLGQHRQRRADRKADCPAFVGELDDPVARRLGGPERRRAGDGDEAHACDGSRTRLQRMLRCPSTVVAS